MPVGCDGLVTVGHGVFLLELAGDSACIDVVNVIFGEEVREVHEEEVEAVDVEAPVSDRKREERDVFVIHGSDAIKAVHPEAHLVLLELAVEVSAYTDGDIQRIGFVGISGGDVAVGFGVEDVTTGFGGGDHAVNKGEAALDGSELVKVFGGALEGVFVDGAEDPVLEEV